MMPLYEMMRHAHRNEATRQMAKHFGLSEAQVADAYAALMPAFSAGLKRSVDGPQPLGAFLQALADGHHRRYFEDLQDAFSPAGIADGNAILGHVFGSKELSRAVAAQAARATGIAQDVLKDMLPVLAAAIMGGIYKQATDGLSGAPRPARQQPDVFGDMLRQMIRYQAAGRTDLPDRPPESSPFFANPALSQFTDFMESVFGSGQLGTREGPDEEKAASSTDLEKLFGPMLDAGKEIEDGYRKSMEHLFDQYRGNARDVR